MYLIPYRGFSGSSVVKNPLANGGNEGLIPCLGRSPGDRNGYLLQYSCLENPMDGGAWWATAHGVAKSRTRLSDFTSQVISTQVVRVSPCEKYCSKPQGDSWVLLAKAFFIFLTNFSEHYCSRKTNLLEESHGKHERGGDFLEHC